MAAYSRFTKFITDISSFGLMASRQLPVGNNQPQTFDSSSTINVSLRRDRSSHLVYCVTHIV
ncbi:MAG TPA: hypothetical protein V6D50_00190 [Chroococcales cyanobacterium]